MMLDLPRVRYGVHHELEAEADRLIKQSMAGVTSMAAKSDVLTPWKEQDRKNKELLVGVADPAARKGMYHRAYNNRDVHMNSRDGNSPRGHRTGSTLAEFVSNNPIRSQFETGDDS